MFVLVDDFVKSTCFLAALVYHRQQTEASESPGEGFCLRLDCGHLDVRAELEDGRSG